MHACKDTSVDIFGELFWLNWPAVQEIYVGSSSRQFMPCVGLISNEKNPKDFQPQAVITNSVSMEANLQEVGWLWTWRWKQKTSEHVQLSIVFIEPQRKEIYFRQPGTVVIKQDPYCSWTLQVSPHQEHSAELPSSSFYSPHLPGSVDDAGRDTGAWHQELKWYLLKV